MVNSLMKIDGLAALIAGLICSILLNLKIGKQNKVIQNLQQKAVDEQVAVWYTSPEGEKGFKWISEIFEEQIAKN